MAQLLTPATFEFFARYLLAGFVLIAVRSRFIAGERPNLGERLIEAVILSLIVQTIFQILAFGASKVWHLGPIDARLTLALEVVALPALLGVVAGRMLRSGWHNAMLRRLAMPVEHPVQRAYDFAFERVAEPCFVILSFENGQRVYGYFGRGSLAASDPSRSDIFLERLYDVGEDAQWYEKVPGRSALISLSGIRSIEFLDSEGSPDA